MAQTTYAHPYPRALLSSPVLSSRILLRFYNQSIYYRNRTRVFYWCGGSVRQYDHSRIVYGAEYQHPYRFFHFLRAGGGINVALRLMRVSWALQPAELVLIYIMMIIAATVPTKGFTEAWLPKITGPYYYATPENDWATLAHPHIKDWLTPRDPEMIKYFFEGLPEGMGIPWGVWFEPLFHWSLFFLVLCFVMICISVILHRQWAPQ